MFKPYFVDFIRSDINQRYWMVHFKDFDSKDIMRYGTVRIIYDVNNKELYGWNYDNMEQQSICIDKFNLNGAIYDTGPEVILVGLEPENDEQDLIEWWKGLDDNSKKEHIKTLDRLIIESIL